MYGPEEFVLHDFFALLDFGMTRFCLILHGVAWFCMILVCFFMSRAGRLCWGWGMLGCGNAGDSHGCGFARMWFVFA